MEENKILDGIVEDNGFEVVEDVVAPEEGSSNLVLGLAIGGLILVGVGLKVAYDKVKPLAAKAFNKIKNKDSDVVDVDDYEDEDLENVENFEEAKAN